MQKYQAVKQLRNNGDSIVSMYNEDICVTLEFSEKYIKRKRSRRLKIQKDCILLWSWSDDKFRNVEIKNIRAITPLSSILKNQPPEKLNNVQKG